MGNNEYRDPVFYYSRERRLEKASPAVRALNDGTPLRPSLSKTLFATRAHVLIFVTIILLCAMFGMASRISGRDKGLKLGGNTVALVLLREEGTLILGIAKSMPASGEAYTGAVDIAVSPVMPKSKEGETAAEVPPVFTHRIFFMPVESETYRAVLPFTGNDFLVLLRTDTEQKSVRIKITDSGK
jgi:hypothetical protein